MQRERHDFRTDTESGDDSHTAEKVITLTPREYQVARLLAVRRSNREIAEALNLSPATAKRHTENILLKLDLHSRRDVERMLPAEIVAE